MKRQGGYIKEEQKKCKKTEEKIQEGHMRKLGTTFTDQISELKIEAPDKTQSNRGVSSQKKTR